MAYCTLLAILIAFPPSLAWHGAEEPLVAAVPFDADHWAAWRITLAAPGNVTIEAAGNVTNAEMVAFGSAILPANAPSLGSAWFVNQVPTNDVYVQTQGEAPLVDIKEGLATGYAGAAFTWFNVPAGESVIVAMWTSIAETTDGTIELRANGATVLSATEGSTTIAALPRDFKGTLNTLARVPNANAWALVDAAHTESVEHTLFGFFWRHPSTSANPLHSLTCAIEYDGPDGGAAGEQYYFIENAPAGTYTFRVPHCADAGAWIFRSQLFVIGADVSLPS